MCLVHILRRQNADLVPLAVVLVILPHTNLHYIIDPFFLHLCEDKMLAMLYTTAAIQVIKQVVPTPTYSISVCSGI